MSEASVTTLLGASGACPEIRLNGKTWRVGHPTQKAKAELETIIVSQAFAEVKALRDVLPPDDYRDLYADTASKVRAKAFRTWGDEWERYALGATHAHLFLLSLLRENHPDATEADALALLASCGEEVQLALGQVVADFFVMLLAEHPRLKPEERATVAAKARAGMLAALAKVRPTPTPATSSE